MEDQVPDDPQRDRRPLATSRFVDQANLDRQGFEKGDFWLGRTLSGRPFGWHDDTNLLTCAGIGAGKSVGAVVPNLLLFPGSAVVIDPKGELASMTARYRRDELGQKVIVLDPARVADVPEEMRGIYNPLAQLDMNDPGVVSAAQNIASGIVVPNPKSKEPFWDQSALGFIQALILYMLSYYPAHERTLMKLRALAAVGDWGLFQRVIQQKRENGDEEGANSLSERPEEAFNLLLRVMSDCNDFGGVVREEAAKIRQMGDSTRGNVLGNVRTHMDFLKDPLLWDALKHSSDPKTQLQLSDLRNKEQRTTVYVCLPVDMMYVQGRWMRLIAMQIFQHLQRTPFNKATDWPVLMMIDEFFQLGPIPAIENTLTYARGFGLRLWLVVQDIGQLKKNYPESWETILGACGIKQFFGINDLATAKYLSEVMGEEEVDVPSITINRSLSETDGTSRSSTLGQSSSFTDGTSTSESESSGVSFGRGDGGSTTFSGDGFSATSSSNRSHGWNRGSSESKGRSTSSTRGTSTSETDGTSRSETTGQTRGFTINKQTRRLLRPEEIMMAFTRDNLTQLVHVRDHGGMMLMRTPFFADPHFSQLLLPPSENDD